MPREWTCAKCHGVNTGPADGCENCGTPRPTRATAAPEADLACAWITSGRRCQLRGRASLTVGGTTAPRYCGWHWALLLAGSPRFAADRAEFDRWRRTTSEAGYCDDDVHVDAEWLFEAAQGRRPSREPVRTACASGWPSCPYAKPGDPTTLPGARAMRDRLAAGGPSPVARLADRPSPHPSPVAALRPDLEPGPAA